MVKERALDVFELLAKVDRKDYQIWDALTPEQRKEFSPLITMRWMASTSDAFQLIMLNEVVNTTVFTLGEHKELMMKLLAVCSSGGSKRYGWVNYKVGGSSRKISKAVQLIADRYVISIAEAEDTRKLFTAAEVMELGESMGLQKDELQELKKELK